ncbi:MAG: UDP-N-acetylmuramate--L-alanine ligase, partial [Desulfacinum sp.]|nr:UDP-N-acetylmuramate--L-alanine ligase [Desulfacinum sp.]
VVAFQPHRYSRTRGLMDQFAKCFYQSDVLLVTEIYGAGEAPLEGVTGKRLAEEVARYGHHDITYCETLDGMTEALLQRVQPGDVVVTLGAGNIWQVGEALLERLAARAP